MRIVSALSPGIIILTVILTEYRIWVTIIVISYATEFPMVKTSSPVIARTLRRAARTRPTLFATGGTCTTNTFFITDTSITVVAHYIISRTVGARIAITVTTPA